MERKEIFEKKEFTSSEEATRCEDTGKIRIVAGIVSLIMTIPWTIFMIIEWYCDFNGSEIIFFEKLTVEQYDAIGNNLAIIAIVGFVIATIAVHSLKYLIRVCLFIFATSLGIGSALSILGLAMGFILAVVICLGLTISIPAVFVAVGIIGTIKDIECAKGYSQGD